MSAKKRNVIRTRVGRITPEVFTSTKKLQEAGMSTKDIAGILHIGKSTVSKIKTCLTIEEYNSVYNGSRKKQEVEVVNEDTKSDDEKTSPVASTVVYNSEVEMYLDRIATALERLADAWETQPEKKKGIFGR